MKQALLVIVLCVLLCSALLAVDCPKPPDNQPCPNGCPHKVGNDCQVDTKFLLTNEACVEGSPPHRAIELAPGDNLILVRPNADPQYTDFTVGDFKSYDLIIHSGVVSCGGTSTPASGAFTDDTMGAARKHVLTAVQEGCYRVNLSFTVDGNPCTIDPHIIIRQSSPTALHQQKKKSTTQTPH
jgi:hypothetical protein